jgi:hypothetical protein
MLGLGWFRMKERIHTHTHTHTQNSAFSERKRLMAAILGGVQLMGVSLEEHPPPLLVSSLEDRAPAFDDIV